MNEITQLQFDAYCKEIRSMYKEVVNHLVLIGTLLLGIFITSLLLLIGPKLFP